MGEMEAAFLLPLLLRSWLRSSSRSSAHLSAFSAILLRLGFVVSLCAVLKEMGGGEKTQGIAALTG